MTCGAAIGFTRVGNIIGTAISATVLIILCVANAFILYTLVKRLRGELARRQVDPEADGDGPSAEADATADTALNDDPFKMQGVGIMARTFRFLFKAVDRPWKMYPLGVVFGLGFDTSSEVAILGISSLQALKGTSIWLILIFPVLFTCKSRSL